MSLFATSSLRACSSLTSQFAATSDFRGYQQLYRKTRTIAFDLHLPLSQGLGSRLNHTAIPAERSGESTHTNMALVSTVHSFSFSARNSLRLNCSGTLPLSVLILVFTPRDAAHSSSAPLPHNSRPGTP